MRWFPTGLILIGAAAICSNCAIAADDVHPRVIDEFAVARHGAPLLVPMRIAGCERELLMVVDTGATASHIDARHLDALGPLIGERIVQGVHGAKLLAQHSLTSAAVGSLGYWSGDILVSDMKLHCEWTGCDIDGILGMDFLKKRILQVNYDEGRLRFLSGVPKDSGTKLAITYQSPSRPLVSAEIGTIWDEHFLIDTGNFCQSGVTARVMADLKSRREASRLMPVIMRGAREWNGESAYISSLIIGGLEQKNVPIVSSVCNSLGNEYLSRFEVVFDFSHNALYLKKGKRFGEPFGEDRCGIEIGKTNGQIRIWAVAPNSPAARAGCQKGDIILKVDEKEASELTCTELRQFMRSERANVRMRIRRRTDERDVVIGLRSYIETSEALAK